MVMKKVPTAAVIFILFAGLCTSADAVSIPLGGSGWAFVINQEIPGGQVYVPYIYEVNPDAVIIEIGKLFSSFPQNGIYTPIHIEFKKTSAQACSQIIINDEYVINETSTIWFDYHMQLMVDIFHPQAGFNPNYLPSGDQLENVFYSEYYGYNGLPIQLNFLDNNGSGVPFAPVDNDVFRPGLQSGQIVILTDPSLQVGTRFGLKEVPTPEPATLILLASGSLIIVSRKKNKGSQMTG